MSSPLILFPDVQMQPQGAHCDRLCYSPHVALLRALPLVPCNFAVSPHKGQKHEGVITLFQGMQGLAFAQFPEGTSEPLEHPAGNSQHLALTYSEANLSPTPLSV